MKLLYLFINSYSSVFNIYWCFLITNCVFPPLTKIQVPWKPLVLHVSPHYWAVAWLCKVFVVHCQSIEQIAAGNFLLNDTDQRQCVLNLPMHNVQLIYSHMYKVKVNIAGEHVIYHMATVNLFFLLLLTNQITAGNCIQMF